MTTATYAVRGLTCGLCIAKVMEGVRLLPGVIRLSVTRGAGGPAQLIVTSGSALASEEVRRAVELAGFDLTDITYGRSAAQARQRERGSPDRQQEDVVPRRRVP
jgi:copper chaperone